MQKHRDSARGTIYMSEVCLFCVCARRVGYGELLAQALCALLGTRCLSNTFHTPHIHQHTSNRSLILSRVISGCRLNSSLSAIITSAAMHYASHVSYDVDIDIDREYYCCSSTEPLCHDRFVIASRASVYNIDRRMCRMTPMCVYYCAASTSIVRDD